MMAHGGGEGIRFDLPDEVLSVIPTDPYDQLDLARKITSMAIASRVNNLEAESGSLRQKLHDKDRLIQELEEKVLRLDGACHDAELRLRIAHEDNMKLLKENDSLALAVKKLNRDLAKLETFKRQLMQSLNDENSPQTETVDIGTYDQSSPRNYSENEDESNFFRRSKSYSGSTDNSNKTSQLTPTGSPKVISSISTRGYAAAGFSQTTSAPPSPRTLYDGLGSLQHSAANSPPCGRPLPGRSPRIDGKEFFRQVRSHLSLEQFTAFLANIKEFNAQKQSREETLRKAEEIFGMDNRDLYVSFEGLLNRNIQ